MFATVDIGGTHTRIALSSNLDSFINRPIIFDTPASADDGIEQISSHIKSASSLSALQGVSIGVAGILKDKKLIRSPNLNEWTGRNIASELVMRLNVPVLIENDAALAGLGEAHFGNGSDDNITAYITISTGIGGSRIEYGKITQRAFSLEPGKQIIDTGSEKTLEDMASGGALSKTYDKQPQDIDKSVWPNLSRYMAVGIYNSILHWSPDVLVLGGSMTTNEPDLYEMIVGHLKDIAKDTYPLPDMRKSELEGLNGLYGGLVLLNQKL